MKPVLGTAVPCQVAVICKNVEEMKRRYAAMLGAPVPPTSDGGDYEITGCQYMGQPAPQAHCKMAFFDLGGIQLELIEPYGGASTWQDFLDETGGGIHHLAFNVPDLEVGIHACEDFGMKLTQWGKYNDASGAYAYLDARESLGCFIELLCSFPQ